MTVEIKIYGETARDALYELREFSAGLQPRTTKPGPAVLEPEQARAIAEAREIAGVKSNSTIDEEFGPNTAAEMTHEELAGSISDGPSPSPKRERGKPSPGRARRTKEEIAEDEAADAAEAHQRGLAGVNELVRETFGSGNQAQISSGENRNGPEDDAETEAQDRADEQAETEANRNGLTLDDLRMAIGGYQKRYGMAAVTADVSTLLGKKMMEVTDDELPEAIQAMKDATENNPLGREPVAKPSEAKKEPEAPPATKADVVAALMAYALKYDGQNTDQNNMPNTMADGPKVLQLLFGADVNAAGKIPASPENYAKAVAGINEMIAKDPYKRGAK